MSRQKAAELARNAASTQQGHFAELSASMCWDAVAHCLRVASGAQIAPISSYSYQHVISTADPAITSVLGARSVPQGAFIGFFDGVVLVHAMIATGFGFAAGNKNACLGIGSPVGWENLDIASQLTWGARGATVGGGRVLAVHYRAHG